MYAVVRGRTRRALLRRFPYGVFYAEHADEVVVLARARARGPAAVAGARRGVARGRDEDRIGQAATREVRRVIQELNPGRRFEHRLMDYNNLPTTSFDDIKRVLRLARERVAAQLAGPSR